METGNMRGLLIGGLIITGMILGVLFAPQFRATQETYPIVVSK